MKLTIGFSAMLLALTLTPSSARAQANEPAPKERASRPQACQERPDACETRTFYLANASQQNDANEILVAIRNIVSPSDKVYLVASQNAIIMQATPEDLKLAQKIITDLDRPKKTYRLTYTLTDSDAGKRIGTQHFSIIVYSGQRAVLKQGSKVPVLTGSYSNGGSDSKTGPGVQTQYTYLDIGMNFDATLNEVAQGAVLRTKVEQSSIAEQISSIAPQDPIVRQTVVEGTVRLTPGKPLILGSIDIIGSTRHLDIDVMMESLP